MDARLARLIGFGDGHPNLSLANCLEMPGGSGVLCIFHSLNRTFEIMHFLLAPSYRVTTPTPVPFHVAATCLLIDFRFLFSFAGHGRWITIPTMRRKY